jgi:hypothetical protein
MLQLGKKDCSLILSEIYTGTSTLGVPSYLTNVSSIESISVSKLSKCCEETVLETFAIIPAPFELDFDILSCPGDNCGNDGEKLSITQGDTANVASYLWEVTRSSSVIWSDTTVNTADICISLTGNNSLLQNDIISLTVTLTDGTVIKRSKIVDIADVQNCIYTYSQSTITITDRPYNIDDDNNIVLNSSGFGDTDGVYSINFTINYTDSQSQAQVYTGKICQLLDCQLECDLATYIATKYNEEKYNEVVEIMKLHEAVQVLVDCSYCCTACGMYNLIINTINATENICYACE